ncbi:MAG: DUF4157 domain-containing protein [Phototrophicaceae bacterium]
MRGRKRDLLDRQNGQQPQSEPARTPENESVNPQRDLLALQQSVGNRAVTERLNDERQSFPPGDPRAVMDRLGTGRALDGALRARMQSAFGRDLSHVQVHTDDEATRLTNEHNARAVAVGDHVAFSPGEYRPGTLIGDGLIAHELAHVMQQDEAGPVSMANAAHERDANRSAFGAVASAFGMARGALSGLAANAAPRMKTGLSLQSCERHQRYETPEFMGEHSRQAVEDINGIIESSEMLENFIVGGTVVTMGTSNPAENLAGESYDIEPQVRALMAVPVIRRERIRTVITLLLVQHGNDLNEQERAFWNRALEALDRADSRSASEE